MWNKIFLYVVRRKCVRRVVQWAERNHLTNRTREDLCYGTRMILKGQKTVLSCVKNRQEVRPQNCIRKVIYDIKHADEPEEILLEESHAIRNMFRYIGEVKHMEAIREASSAPCNNHIEAGTTRNAASILLSTLQVPKKVCLYSLSGAKKELEAVGCGFRGRFQPSDCAVPEQYDKNLSQHPSLIKDSSVIAPISVIISTDTTNHLSEHEKNVLLGNGIAILSYCPHARINNRTDSGVEKERISFWQDGKLRTNVNGGGDYEDNIWNLNSDIIAAKCPNGDMMLVYIDTWLDKADPSHIFVAEVPFCKLLRNSATYNLFVGKVPPVARLSPYSFEYDGMSISTFSIRHSDIIQITNNTTRTTDYFTRNELASLKHSTPGRYVYIVLSSKPPVLDGVERDTARRRQLLEQIGLSNIEQILKNSPELNLPTKLDPSKHHASLRIMTGLIVNRNGEDEVLKATEHIALQQSDMELKTTIEEFEKLQSQHGAEGKNESQFNNMLKLCKKELERRQKAKEQAEEKRKAEIESMLQPKT